jgi:Tfp pilus assembly protein PilF
MIHGGMVRALGIVGVAVLLLSLPACEKKTHRDSRREYQSLMSAPMSEDDRAEALEAFIRRFPETKTNPNLVRACQHLAQYHARAGRHDLATSWYERAVRARPDDPDSLNRLGYHYANQGVNLDRAVEVLELAVRLAEERGYPDRRQGFFNDSLGWAYRMRGDLPRAVELLEEAGRLAPGVPILREHLAEAYRASGEPDRAIDLYLQLFLETRGTEPRYRIGMMAIGEEGGPDLTRRMVDGQRRTANRRVPLQAVLLARDDCGPPVWGIRGGSVAPHARIESRGGDSGRAIAGRERPVRSRCRSARAWSERQ